jgi:hypothetical protein
MEVSGQLYIWTALDLGKEPQVPTEYKKGWTSELKEKKKYLSPAGNRPQIICPTALSPHHQWYLGPIYSVSSILRNYIFAYLTEYPKDHIQGLR